MKSKKNKQKLYRLSLLEDATHEKIYSIKFSKSKFFGLLVLFVSVIIGGLYCLLVFTPLHYSIPGYPNANFRSQAISNAIKIDSLERAMIRWELYAENLNRTLTGIARIYELQLKAASQQVNTQDEINDQTRKLAQQIAELNAIYARMIEAMSVNMK